MVINAGARSCRRTIAGTHSSGGSDSPLSSFSQAGRARYILLRVVLLLSYSADAP